MSQPAQESNRRDAIRNRARLIAAARGVFAAQGPEAPLEDIARAASVSRTTLYRNFATREELAATVFEDNIAQLEQYAVDRAGSPGAVIEVFHAALDMQLNNPALARALSRTDIEGFKQLARRTARVFAPLLDQGHHAALVHPGVGVDDLMLTLPMAAAAMIEDDIAGRPRNTHRVRILLHRALFTTSPPLMS